jgi:hypothetical protein
LTDCTFKSNRGTSYYGGLFCGYANAQVIATRCLFQENSAAYGGGAMGCGGSLVSISQSHFVGNAVGEEGQMWSRGGAIMVSDSEVTARECIFRGNRSGERGAVLYNDRSRIDLINCTLAGNTALDGRTMVSSSYAEAIARFRATNCIIRNGGNEMFSESTADIRIAYSDIQGNYDGPGNIDADPYFVDAGRWDNHDTPADLMDDIWTDGDYHLLSQAGYWSPVFGNWIAAVVSSPCIDAGDPNSPVGDEPQPNGGRINMGAYGGTAEASKSPVNN